MKISDTLIDFSIWWRDTVGGMLPSSLFTRVEKSDAVLEITPVEYRVIAIGQAGGSAGRHFSDLGQLESELKEVLGSRRLSGKRIVIRLLPGSYLDRKISPLRLPASKAQRMADLDMLANTPLKPDDVYVVTERSNKTSSNYAVIKKTILAPVLEAVKRIPITISAIQFDDGNCVRPASNSSVKSMLPIRRVHKIGRQLNAVLAMLLVIGIAITYTHLRYRQFQAEKIIDAELEVASQKAMSVRKMITSRNEVMNRLLAIRREKSDTIPVVVAIEELSQILPDNSWITDLEIEQGTVRFSGFSRSAANLIPLLEKSELFRSPTFRSPVLRVSDEIGDRFSITMMLEKGNV